MSHIVEKTFASIPKLLTQSLIGGSGGASKMNPRQKPSIEVQNFMKAVHRARSKLHEANIVNSELNNIQQKLKQGQLVSNSTLVRSSFTKIIFCHLLGYNVTSMAIYAVNLAQQGRGFDKHLGYLLSCLLLGPHHEMAVLMMATLLRDLKSSNLTDNCIALKVAGELVNDETIPMILPEVIKKLHHQHDLVREKAIHCFRSFNKKGPQLCDSELDRLKVFLASRDPGVLMAVTTAYVQMTSENPSQFISLGTSFFHILNQINNRGFGSNYSYHMVPLPWLQINLLRVLGNLGSLDQSISETVSPLLKSLIEKTKVSVPISLALLVECILTATKIQPNESLLQLCSRCIMKLLASNSSEDMRYQGLGLLIALSRIKPSFAVQHQAAVVECLSNQDASIQSRTTILLHAMANRANIKAICSKLFDQLKLSKDSNFQQEILVMISDLAERFSPSVEWYISTYLEILSYDLSQNRAEKITDLMLKKVKNISSTDQSDVIILVNTVFSLLENHPYFHTEFSLAIQMLNALVHIFPKDFNFDRFLNIVANCLSKSTSDGNECLNTNDVRIYDICNPNFFNNTYQTQDDDTSILILQLDCIMVLTKMVLYEQIPPANILKWLDDMNYTKTIRNSYISSDLNELQDLASNPDLIKLRSTIFSNDGTHIDLSLSFLDGMVVKDLLAGKACYKPAYFLNAKCSSLMENSLSLDNLKENESILEKSLTDSLLTSSVETNEIGKTKSKRTIPNKWRDSIDGIDGEWNLNESGISERFVLVDSNDSCYTEQEESKRKQKAASELFAGLHESSFDELDMSGVSVESPKKVTGKSLWDDDDNDNGVVGNYKEHESNDPSVFNVGNLSIHPFGITKKPKSKSSKWNLDNFDVTADLTCVSQRKFVDSVPIEALEDLNNVDSSGSIYHGGSMYQTDSPFQESVTLWSEVQETADDMGKNVNFQTSLLSPDTLVGSAVDALTDSDPEASET